METATQIIPKTLPELEDYIHMNGEFVPGDPGNPARKDALRAKMLTRELLRIPHAGRDDYGIKIHNDRDNLFGFEQNINNIIITTSQLFDTLVKTVDAAGALNDPASRRGAFRARFDHMQWICVDGSVTEILEFIANSAFIIDTKQSFLLNFMRRINMLIAKICAEYKYFKLERAYFIKLLNRDEKLLAYVQNYKDNLEGVREKAELNIPVGRPDFAESTSTIISAVVNHMINEDAITILRIGTTEFFQGCIVEEAPAGANQAAIAAAAERNRASFEAKLRARPQNLEWIDFAVNPNIIMKLTEVYTSSKIVIPGRDEVNATIIAVTPPTVTIAVGGINEEIHFMSINNIVFSNPAPA